MKESLELAVKMTERSIEKELKALINNSQNLLNRLTAINNSNIAIDQKAIDTTNEILKLYSYYFDIRDLNRMQLEFTQYKTALNTIEKIEMK